MVVRTRRFRDNPPHIFRKVTAIFCPSFLMLFDVSYIKHERDEDDIRCRHPQWPGGQQQNNHKTENGRKLVDETCTNRRGAACGFPPAGLGAVVVIVGHAVWRDRQRR
ncbi:protein of unknown function (plasmid) [Cupriavidus taiwanensis]|uniref:Uncharacterized protein n=1 Tax=Cupriavidus taiwanensis TaxID=164546 RepID=A0A7Z7JEX7_9BURK|nr:hypothetical protein CBM2585_B50456 [Cupriavidus taiwanensis]SOZ09906.1 protein of unknown function [Cupriavidus taiwanensis]SOZ43379.1 protein of unknown function [Cupriavidus taiwanensis]SPC22622.1 protein of unknown function [Cupriavidus taiwanensis]SPD54132.1 protein of unknown function [Cupriavidus taiwanensis]